MRANHILLKVILTALLCPTIVHAGNFTSRHAIVTVLTNISDEYLQLAIVLGYSITMYADVDNRVDRIIVTPFGDDLRDTVKQKLEFAGWTVVQMPAISPPAGVNVDTVKHARYVGCFSKLHVFNMTQYDVVLSLDADTMLCGNIMELFTYYAPHMQKHGVHLAMARDSISDANADATFNAGVMLVRPSRTLTEELISNPHSVTFNHALSEQGFLTAVFNTTHYIHAESAYKQLHVLPQKFNLMAHIASTDQALWQKTRKDARIFHFTWLKPTAQFLLLRCAYMGTLHFCKRWTHIQHITHA